MERLVDLNVAFNRLTGIEGLARLHHGRSALTTLNICGNRIANMAALYPISGCVVRFLIWDRDG
jgi:hypothetical protein